MLESLKIGSAEWCGLHWIRIKNGINYGISKERIEEIYENITYLRNNCNDKIRKYRKYLLKVDNSIEIKREILRYLISD
jgi:hypothetical protein